MSETADFDSPLKAVEWLNAISAKDEVTRLNEAEFFIVKTLDSETGSTWYHGPFADFINAMAWAETTEAGLNTGLMVNDKPFKCTVHPVLAPDSPA